MCHRPRIGPCQEPSHLFRNIAAVKAATHLVNTTAAYYQNSGRSRSSDTASVRSMPADPPPFRGYALATQSETALSQHNTSISRSRPLPSLPTSRHHDASRQRPLPQRPVPSVPSVRHVPVRSPSPQPSTNSGTNPFDPNDHDEPPPPAYESHHQDAYIDPQDVDRVLRQRAA
ncbi:hypothetical protein BCR43DRAFT_495315 [Syncephalastrum racemosum]|uniref:Uncharacterized protein n=1 Tax=Syncephalastrum racemosum TaxID=13706 RepID=A0A1X2H5N4_SYNRA|nr:hypothetical protein BCR43DRAFT_495315 [Syncephalastrum racemosum]